MRSLSVCLLVAGCLGLPAAAEVIVNYTHDAGGASTAVLNGLSASAVFDIDGTHLTILLENTSSGVPADFDAASSLLVSLGMNMPGVSILAGDSAVVAPGAHGIGAWSSLAAGDSVGEQWLWTNDFGGDLMDSWAQVISTSEGQGGGTSTRFDGGSGGVNGPYGGIAAAPPIISVPGSKQAVSNAVIFELTLSGTLSEAQLQSVANKSVVEFGSDQRYLTVPEPGALALLAVAGLLRRRG